MNLYDRHTTPDLYAVTFYKTNPDDVDPPLATVAVHDLGNSELTAIARLRELVRCKVYEHDSWELVRRSGLHWEAFDAQCGSWEWRDENVLDSWQDPEEYRVSLICGCQNDVAYGFGSTREEARHVAERVFVEHHGRKTMYTQTVYERAVEHAGGGSHYELMHASVRWVFPPGTGRALAARGVVLAIEGKRPGIRYVFESADRDAGEQLLGALFEIAYVNPKARKLGEAAKNAHEKLKPIMKAVYG